MNIDSGVDIVEVNRIRKAVERWQDSFLNRIFTPLELRYANGRKSSYQHLAARFAAKEAFYKALGDSWDKAIKWTEVEIRNTKFGKPFVRLSGRAEQLRKRLKVIKIIISMSHTRNYAFASAILVKGGREELKKRQRVKGSKGQRVKEASLA